MDEYSGREEPAHPPENISDECLRAAIMAKLTVDERTAKAKLRVGVLHGIAHITGKVDSLEERAAAEEIAQLVPGVRGVVNRIEAPGAPSPARTINLDLNSQNQYTPSEKSGGLHQ